MIILEIRYNIVFSWRNHTHRHEFRLYRSRTLSYSRPHAVEIYRVLPAVFRQSTHQSPLILHNYIHQIQFILPNAQLASS